MEIGLLDNGGLWFWNRHKYHGVFFDYKLCGILKPGWANRKYNSVIIGTIGDMGNIWIKRVRVIE